VCVCVCVCMCVCMCVSEDNRASVPEDDEAFSWVIATVSAT